MKRLQSGLIIFTGLHLVEPFALPDEVHRFAQEFFRQKGLVVDSLHVGFSPEEPHAWLDEEFGTCPLAGYYWFPEGERPAVIEVYPAHIESRLDFFETLGHECDHAAWVLEGREWREDLPFWQRPQEARARKTEQSCPELLESKIRL